MKLSKDFLLKEIAGSYVLIPIGQSIVACNNLLRLNDTGAFIMKKLEEEISFDELLDALKLEYEPENDEEVALLCKDLKDFLEKAREINALIEE